MSATLQELFDFNRFAEEKLSLGRSVTLQDLLDEWNAQREHQQSIEGIRESMRQYEAGQALPLDEAFAEIRQKLGRRE
jgi:hypothetical protein